MPVWDVTKLSEKCYLLSLTEAENELAFGLYCNLIQQM